MKEENLMDLEGVGGPPGDGVPNDLKQMLESGCVIDVDICDAVATVHKKRIAEGFRSDPPS